MSNFTESLAGRTVQFEAGPLNGEYTLDEQLLGSDSEFLLYSSGFLAFKAFGIASIQPADVESLQKKEWHIGNSLRHPNLMPYYDQGTLFAEDNPQSAQTAIAMPRILDGTLADLKNYYKNGVVPPALVAKIIEQTAEGVDYLHRQNFTHGDIKPGNIFYHYRRRAVVADFGNVLDTGDTWLNKTNVSLAYAAREQLFGVQTFKSDTHNLAATTYELLAGNHLLSGRGFENIATEGISGVSRLSEVLEEESPPDFESHGLQMNKVLERMQEVVIEKGLAKEADQRPTVLEFASMLQEAATTKSRSATIIDLARSAGNLAKKATEQTGLVYFPKHKSKE